MRYLLTYITSMFATSMLSYSMFFCDDAILMRECLSCGRYNNSEIGTLQCFFLVIVDRIKWWCNDILCSTQQL